MFERWIDQDLARDSAGQLMPAQEGLMVTPAETVADAAAEFGRAKLAGLDPPADGALVGTGVTNDVGGEQRGISGVSGMAR